MTVAQTPAVPVHWSAGSTVPVFVHAGTLFYVPVYAAIDPGWHLYAMQQPVGGPMETEIALAKDYPGELLRVAQQRPLQSSDSQFSLRTAYFEHAAKFTLYVRREPMDTTTTETMNVIVRYQACNDRLCLPPQNATVAITYRVRS